MQKEELIAYYPRVLHMAHADAWPGIRRHGLLSTERLVDLFDVDGAQRLQLLRMRRPDSVKLSHPVRGEVVIRDQKPLAVSKLVRLLDGITVADYLMLLNARVFCWTSYPRLLGLLNGRAYRDEPQLVLTLDTASLVKVHGDAIALTRINSGATVYIRGRRGEHTFESIQRFVHPRPRAGSTPRAVIELTIAGGVPDITDHLIRAERWEAGRVVETLFAG